MKHLVWVKSPLIVFIHLGMCLSPFEVKEQLFLTVMLFFIYTIEDTMSLYNIQLDFVTKVVMILMMSLWSKVRSQNGSLNVPVQGNIISNDFAYNFIFATWDLDIFVVTPFEIGVGDLPGSNWHLRVIVARRHAVVSPHLLLFVVMIHPLMIQSHVALVISH